MKHALLASCFLITLFTTAQKKSLTHEDYDLWKNINRTSVSENGNYILTEIAPLTKRGDGYAELYDVQEKKSKRFENAYQMNISNNEEYIVFLKKPAYEHTRKEKKDKVKKKDRAKDVLYIYDIKQQRIHDSVTRTKTYLLPKKNNNYLIIERFKNNDTITDKKKPAKKNNYAIVYHLPSKSKDTIFNIKDMAIDERGMSFFYTIKNEGKKKKSAGIYKYDFASETGKVIDTTKFNYKKLRLSKSGKHFAYIAQRDSSDTDSVFELYTYSDKKLQQLALDAKKELGIDKFVGDNTIFFSENDERLYFYAKSKSKYTKDTTLLKDEIPEVDVWSWQDKMIQPQQKVNEKRLKSSADLHYYDFETDTYVQLEDALVEDVNVGPKNNNRFILGYDRKPYQLQGSWEMPTPTDYYIIDSKTGDKQLAIQGNRFYVYTFPESDYGLFFNSADRNWYSLHMETGKKINLTGNLRIAFDDEENDLPNIAYPYGFGGLDQDGNAFVYDRFDIWKLTLNGSKKAENITKLGRVNNIQYRLERLDNENPQLATYLNGKLFLKTFDNNTKAHGVSLLDNSGIQEIIAPSNEYISRFTKAKNNETLTFQKGNFVEPSNLYVTTTNFKNHTRVTNTNPQQEMFNWGTSELVKWRAFDNTLLEGIVYKPENFDPSKKYPMIVYFYEKSADGLHYPRMPRPSASTINIPYAVSNGYIVFVPDIVYNVGQPGKDAYNCVISGVEFMEKNKYIDSSRMAIQGQSWGGYQVAYLVTKTNKFKAAMAGAPVSNMTSAYGGIRWASGMSRAFQYERTQSRIGKNLWEGLDNYIESSPLFSIPDIQTPLLIMHNDNDGAVPYYQGIELFLGMRRLQKPVWMLVYNNENHNLSKMKNRQDLSIRMMQFFDHYLQDAPPPIWMTKGVPRTEKGINFGYELDTEEKK